MNQPKAEASQRCLKARGFRGSLRVVSEWATRRRRLNVRPTEQLQNVPSARTIARLMTTARDHLSKANALTIAAIEAGGPMLAEARDLIDRLRIPAKSANSAPVQCHRLPTSCPYQPILRAVLGRLPRLVT